MKVARNLLFRCGYKADKMRNFIVNESIWFDYALQHTLLFNYSNERSMHARTRSISYVNAKKKLFSGSKAKKCDDKKCMMQPNLQNILYYKSAYP